LSDDADERRLLGAADLALGAVGFYVAAVGPALATLAADLDVSLDTAGLALTASAAGGVLASASVAARFHRLSQRRVAAAGAALLVVASLGLALAPWFAGFIVAATLAGAGCGLADAGSHGLATSAARPDIAVSKLNRAFAIGAMLGPAWSGLVLTITEDRWIVFAGLTVVGAVVTVLLALAPEWRPPSANRDSAGAGALLSLPVAVFAMSGLLFLYVGAEIGLGAWITSATRRAADTSLLVGALVTSGYWAALWLGREASGRALGRGFRSERILVVSILGAGAGSLVLSLAGDAVAAGAAGALITGFCFGPIWPAAVAIGTRGAAHNAAATMVTLGNGGGVILPWLQGRVLVESGPRAGMAVSAVLCAGMLALATGTLRRSAAIRRAQSAG
jgi:fucose permease